MSTTLTSATLPIVGARLHFPHALWGHRRRAAAAAIGVSPARKEGA